MTTLDLKDAYLKFRSQSTKSPRSSFNFCGANTCFVFQGLCFGLNIAPRVFTNPLDELKWWLLNIDSGNGSPITPPASTLFITTDASKAGWGAVCQGHRTNGCWSEDKRIRTQGRLLCLNVSSRGLPENGQHDSNSPYKQQGRYEVGLPHNFNVGTLEVVPGEEHSVVDTTRSRQTEHHCRLRIEGVQRQKRMEDKPCLLLACPPSSPST